MVSCKIKFAHLIGKFFSNRIFHFMQIFFKRETYKYLKWKDFSCPCNSVLEKFDCVLMTQFPHIFSIFPHHYSFYCHFHHFHITIFQFLSSSYQQTMKSQTSSHLHSGVKWELEDHIPSPTLDYLFYSLEWKIHISNGYYSWYSLIKRRRIRSK